MVTRMSKSLRRIEKEVSRKTNPHYTQSTKPFYIESDASKWATGAVLRQTDDNGDLKPCGYILHSFTTAERNYNIYD